MPPVAPIELGHALFSLVEPAPGRAVAFNRWYERDHFYAGCMVGPFFFSGRRWVATKRLKALCFPPDNPVAAPGQGSLLVLYWMLKGHYPEALDWAVAQVQQLHREGRMNPDRDNLATGFYEHRWHVARDPDGVPPALALEHPFPGLAVVLVDPAPDDDFEEHCRRRLLPDWLAGTPAALLVDLTPEPLPAGAPANVPRPDPAAARRRLWLIFLDQDPEPCWEQLHRLDTALAAAGARLAWAGAFIPTVPGTDTYMDAL